jgi:hypothetical protein
VHGFNNVRQIEVYAESLASVSNRFEVEVMVEVFEICKPSVIETIPSENFQVRRETLFSNTHKLINPLMNKE